MPTPTGNLQPGGTPPYKPFASRSQTEKTRAGTTPFKVIGIIILVVVVLAIVGPLSNKLGKSISNHVLSGITTAGDPPCTVSHLSLVVGAPSAVSHYVSTYSLVFTNNTAHACSVASVPAASWVTSGVSSIVGVPPSGLSSPERVSPQASVTAMLTVDSVSKWSTSQCGPVRARSIAVTFGSATWRSGLSTLVCTHLTNSFISQVLP